MSATYRVVIRGVREGFTKGEVISLVAPLFKLSEDRLRPLFDTPAFIVKRGLELQHAVKYQAALEERGCACIVEPEAVSDLDFDAAELQSLAAKIVQDTTPQESVNKEVASPQEDSGLKEKVKKRLRYVVGWSLMALGVIGMLGMGISGTVDTEGFFFNLVFIAISLLVLPSIQNVTDFPIIQGLSTREALQKSLNNPIL